MFFQSVVIYFILFLQMEINLDSSWIHPFLPRETWPNASYVYFWDGLEIALNILTWSVYFGGIRYIFTWNPAKASILLHFCQPFLVEYKI
jgi:hypothetical protein